MKAACLILASASPRRAHLMGKLGWDFDIVEAGVPEVLAPFLTARETAQLNAYRKAGAVACLHPQALVLGADTVVCLDDVMLGKPAHLDEARAMLARLQGRSHQVITGVCMIQKSVNRQRLFAVTTQVCFRSLTGVQIDRYLASIDPLDKAGAYAIQEQGDWIVERIVGSFTNVIGLPMEQLQTELQNWTPLGPGMRGGAFFPSSQGGASASP
ncbi:MAG: Maf family protein [Candidatus Omnitrophica bacterium]|nr:Maf family protein [Candidatus Omnitrophota bacterium]